MTPLRVITLQRSILSQVNISLEYFKQKEPWDELLKGGHQAQLNIYWLIAGQLPLLLWHPPPLSLVWEEGAGVRDGVGNELLKGIRHSSTSTDR